MRIGGNDRLGTLRADRDLALRAVLRAEAREEQAQEVVDLGQGGDGALAAAAAGALLDGHGRRNARDRVDVGPRGGLHELPGVGVERLEVAPLALGEEDVEGHGALAAAADAGDDGEAVARDRDVDPLEVVLAGVADADFVAGLSLTLRARSPSSPLAAGPRRPCPSHVPALRPSARLAQGGACAALRRRPPTSAGVPAQTSCPPASPPSGPRSMTQSAARITSRLCSMTTSECPSAIRRRKAASRMAMSSKCSPVVGSSKSRSRPGPPLRPVRPGEVPRELEALGLAAAQRRHRLAELQVAEADTLQRLERGRISARSPKNAAASATVRSSTSAIDVVPRNFTSSTSGR